MSNTQMFGFRLEASDGTETQSQQKGTKSNDAAEATMDTDLMEEIEKREPQIRFNTNFDK